MRRRTQAFVEECVRFRVPFFHPIDDLASGGSKPFNWSHDGKFCVDINWSWDSVGDTVARGSVWYFAYSAEFSARRTRRPERAAQPDAEALEGRDYEKHVVKLELRAHPNVGGNRRWWFRCPKCSLRRGVLYVAPGDATLVCRDCHHLRYASQSGDRHPGLRWLAAGRPSSRDEAEGARGGARRPPEAPEGALRELLAQIGPAARLEAEEAKFRRE